MDRLAKKAHGEQGISTLTIIFVFKHGSLLGLLKDVLHIFHVVIRKRYVLSEDEKRH